MLYISLNVSHNNRRESEKQCYKLHFSQFYEEDDENVVVGFVQDETNENIFIYVSKELNVEYDTLFTDSIEDAKHQIEEMLIDHWNEEIDYSENRIQSFQGEYGNGEK